MRNTKRAVGIKPYSCFRPVFFQETVYLNCKWRCDFQSVQSWEGNSKRKRMRFTLLLVAFISSLTIAAENTDWPNYANDPGSSKFAALDHISASNVQNLGVAWSWDSPDNLLVKNDRKLTPWGFKSTPIKIGKTLYIYSFESYFR